MDWIQKQIHTIKRTFSAFDAERVSMFTASLSVLLSIVATGGRGGAQSNSITCGTRVFVQQEQKTYKLKQDFNTLSKHVVPEYEFSLQEA